MMVASIAKDRMIMEPLVEVCGLRYLRCVVGRGGDTCVGGYRKFLEVSKVTSISSSSGQNNVFTTIWLPAPNTFKWQPKS